MKTRFLAIAFAALFPALAWAQIQPSGNFTPGHAYKALNSKGTAAGDAGGANGGPPGVGLTELGITNTGLPFCINSGPTTGQYHQICMGANSSGGGLIAYEAKNGATQLPLNIDVNGTLYPFPGQGNGNVVGPSTSVINNFACWNNTFGTLLKDCTGIPFVVDNTALAALATSFSATVLRLDYAAGNGAPPLIFLAQTGSCAANSMTNDGGSCVDASNANSWRASHPDAGADVREWGAKCDGTTNDAEAIQAAIVAKPTGIVRLPGGIKICRFNQTLTINASNLTIQGAGDGAPNRGLNTAQSSLACRTGNTNCIQIQPAIGPNVTPDGRIGHINLSDFLLDGTGQTGGNAISVAGVQFANIDRVPINFPWNGLFVWNDYFVRYSNSFILYPQGAYGVSMDSDPAVGSTDLITLDQVQIACGFSGADGIVLDGLIQTVYFTKGGVTDCVSDLHTKNTRHSTTSFPQHIQSTDWAADGASLHAIQIGGGSDFKFANTILDNAPGRQSQGNADQAIVLIADDAGFSNVNNISFINATISDGSRECFVTAAFYVSIVGGVMNNCSLSAPHTYDTLSFTSVARDSTVSGGVIGDPQSRYSVGINTGASNIRITGVDLESGGGGTSGTIIDPGRALVGGTQLFSATTTGVPQATLSYLGPTGNQPSLNISTFLFDHFTRVLNMTCISDLAPGGSNQYLFNVIKTGASVGTQGIITSAGFNTGHVAQNVAVGPGDTLQIAAQTGSTAVTANFSCTLAMYP